MTANHSVTPEAYVRINLVGNLATFSNWTTFLEQNFPVEFWIWTFGRMYGRTNRIFKGSTISDKCCQPYVLTKG